MSEPRRRVVFDANVWVSAVAYPQSVPAQAISAAKNGVVTSIVSEEIVQQVSRTLTGTKFRIDPAIAAATEAEMRSSSEVVVPTTVLTVITAKDSDNRILECAVEGRADLIVTGDR